MHSRSLSRTWGCQDLVGVVYGLMERKGALVIPGDFPVLLPLEILQVNEHADLDHSSCMHVFELNVYLYAGFLYLFSAKSGLLYQEYDTGSGSPITSMASYSIRRNESVISTGHENGEVGIFCISADVQPNSNLFNVSLLRFVLTVFMRHYSPNFQQHLRGPLTLWDSIRGIPLSPPSS